MQYHVSWNASITRKNASVMAEATMRPSAAIAENGSTAAPSRRLIVTM